MGWKIPLYVLLNLLLATEVCIAAAFVGYLSYHSGQDASSSVLHTATLCGLLLIPILALNLWLAERLTLPLSQLNRAAQNLTGDQPFALPTCNPIAEIAALSESFTQMLTSLSAAQQLRENYAQTLERQVIEKTAALQKHATQLREAQRIARVGSWELDLATRQTTWSEELFRIVGMAPIPSGLVHFDIRDVVHAEDWDALDSTVERSISEGSPYQIEHRIVLPNGTVRHVISRGETISDEDGRTTSLSGTVADITQRRQAEAALQKSEARLKLALETSNAVAWEYDISADEISTTGLIVQSSQPQTLSFEQAMATVHPDDRDRVRRATQVAIAKPGNYQIDHRLLITEPTPDCRWLQVSGTVLTDGAGQANRTVGLSIDITERKRLEQELAKNRDFREHLFNESNDALFLIDIDTLKMVDCNWRAVQLFEAASKTDLLTHQPYSFNKKLPTSAELAAAQSRQDYRIFWQGEIEYRSLQGRDFWGDASVKRIAFGEQTFDLIRIVDVTLRMTAELTLKAREARLQRLASNIVGMLYQYVLHPDGSENYSYISPKCRDIYEQEPEELLENSELVAAMVHPDDRERLRQANQRSAQTLAPLDIEFRLLPPSGGVRWVRAAAQPERQTSGDIVWDGIVLDITVQKQLEQNLRRYERIVSATADGISLLDCNYVYQLVNQTYLDRGGKTRDEIIGRSVINLHGEETFQSRIQPRLDRCLQGEIVQYEDWFDCGAIGRRFISVNYSPYREPDSTVSGVIVSTRDITDLEQAEQALRQSELTNRVIVETIPDLLIQMDRQGQFGHLMGGGAASGQPRFDNSADLKFPSSVLRDLQEQRLHYINKALDDKALQVYEQSFEVEGDRCFEEVRIAPLNAQEVLVIIRDITERKQIETELLRLNHRLEARVQERTATLQEREARYRALVEVMPDLLIRMNAEGIYLDFVMGEGIRPFNPEQVYIGSTLYNVLPRKRAQERLANVARALQTREIQTETYELPFADGPRQEEARIIAINDQEVLVIVQDITERIRTQEALHRNEERWQFALEGSGDGVWDWNCQTNSVFFSHQWKAMLGYSDSDIGTGLEEWDSRVHPEDKPQCYADLDRHFRGETAVYQNEHRVRCKDGSYKWILDRGKAIAWTPDGKPLRVIGTHTDITARKLAEQTIREQAALLDIASDAITVRSLEGIIRFWNRGAEQLYGWPAVEAIGRAVQQLQPPHSLLIEEVMPALLREGEWQGELHNTTQAGQEVTVRSRWTLVRDEGGQPQFILTVDTDVTQQKRLEAQFYQAQRLDSLGKLSSGIAHDLNNILTPILTLSQLLPMSQMGLNRQGLEQLGLIETSAQRGADLVKQILTFVQGSRDGITLVDVAALLTEAVNITQQSFPRSIEVGCFVEDSSSLLSTVNANKTQLHQVLMNLCINARDAMPTGGLLTLTLKNTRIDEPLAAAYPNHAQIGQTYVVITVDDTGVGIAADVRDRIFEPFFTTKNPGQGTGLGLSTTLGIVQNYGGFMQVDSAVGMGTRVSVYLPVANGAIVAAPSRVVPHHGNGDQILIVDDDVAVQQSIKLLLENYRYTTLVASSAPEALETYRQQQDAIHLVISDITMPGVSGIAFVAELKQINPAVKVIAISGLLSNQEPVLKAGATVFLGKPYTSDKLIGTVHALIGDGPSCND